MDKSLAIRDDMSLSDLGQTLVKSGFFADSRDAAQAIVKVLAGRELGFGPIASMTGIYVIQGRISMSANILAASIKRSGRYNFRVVELTDKVCTIDFYENGEKIGTSPFTIEDARKAGTKNLDKFPRNMLYARAMSNGARWFTPDIFGGPVYTPEEMGADVNEEGDVINAHFKEPTTTEPPAEPVGHPTPEPEKATTEQPKANGNGTEQHKPAANGKLERPMTPEQLRDAITKRTRTYEQDKVTCTDQDRNMIAANINIMFMGQEQPDQIRHAVLHYLTGNSSVKDLSPAQVVALKKWINATQDSGNEYHPDMMSEKEAKAVWSAALVEAGQQQLI